ncbi:hypothetical protein SK128_007651, partial [Halocaridina rubra]
MATPHLKRVLRTYQNTAMTSLHGPGPESYPNAGVGHKKHELYNKLSYKKALLYEESLKNNNDSCEFNRRRPPSGGGGSSLPSSETQTQPPPAPPHAVIKEEPGEIVHMSLKPLSSLLSSSSSGGNNIRCNSEGGSVETVSSLNRSSTVAGSSPSWHSSGSSTNNNVGPGCSWVEPGDFLAPAPFPPQPWPVLAAADKGSPGGGGGQCEETYLDGEPIACFNVGGEKRLCLPKILNTILREFSLAQINTVCDELRIFCSRCTPPQLDALRNAGVLPLKATSCGLITNTDAQRLTHALLYSRAPSVTSQQQHTQQLPQLHVYHTCFGKCKGLVWEDLYVSGEAACIECDECHGLFPPSRFVCHAHRSLENLTIHWGFEAENWRAYLLLAEDQRMPLERAEVQLKAFKNKFDPAIPNHKRKQ